VCMVNNGLKSPDVTGTNRPWPGADGASAAMRAHFRHESCVNPKRWMGFGRSEVVLAQAILGLLRCVGGASCRGELRNRADLQAAVAV
jgi:hypothetical protein